VMIKNIWGDVPCDYSYESSVGASGGIVTSVGASWRYNLSIIAAKLG